MDFRYLSKEDIPKLENELFSKIGKDFLSRRVQKRRNLLDYVTKKNLFLILAKEKGVIVGYLAYKLEKKGVGKIIGAGVELNFRKRGIAKKMLKQAIQDLYNKKINYIYSRTWETNLASIKLHETLGFKKYRTFKNDRVNGESTIYFRLMKGDVQ